MQIAAKAPELSNAAEKFNYLCKNLKDLEDRNDCNFEM